MAPGPYRIVLLSLHGQSQGATFQDRFGETLGDVVRRAMGPGPLMTDRTGRQSAGRGVWGYAAGAAFR